MGEVIAFKPPKTGMAMRSTQGPAGLILFFTGVRRETPIDPSAPAKRPRRRKEKPAGETRGKSADRVNDSKRR